MIPIEKLIKIDEIINIFKNEICNGDRWDILVELKLDDLMINTMRVAFFDYSEEELEKIRKEIRDFND